MNKKVLTALPGKKLARNLNTEVSVGHKAIYMCTESRFSKLIPWEHPKAYHRQDRICALLYQDIGKNYYIQVILLSNTVKISCSQLQPLHIFQSSSLTQTSPYFHVIIYLEILEIFSEYAFLKHTCRNLPMLRVEHANRILCIADMQLLLLHLVLVQIIFFPNCFIFLTLYCLIFLLIMSLLL